MKFTTYKFLPSKSFTTMRVALYFDHLLLTETVACMCVLDILRAGDEVGRGAAAVAGTVRGVPGGLSDDAAPQSAARARVHRRALRRRLSSVLRRTHQLHAARRLHHGGPDIRRPRSANVHGGPTSTAVATVVYPVDRPCLVDQESPRSPRWSWPSSGP